ncbi:hypothetical protein [Novosphingobium huizhouense]|uniref:hypothetical protein n=1 Tax=Novosphingobium huizhouense TaxID=2866625 RepID=UPI001CD8CBA8|nr:hypothetical protein [Novosphingobium huizhouense]
MDLMLSGMLGVAIVSASLALFADWRWPSAPTRRIALISGFAVPLCFSLIYPLALLWIWNRPSRGLDADGMTLLVIGMFVGFAFLAALIAGVPAAILTLTFLRKRS